MRAQNHSCGRLEITLEEFMVKHNISKNKLSQMAKLQRTQLNLYCNNRVSRLDMNVLARICDALQCEIAEILHYIPEKE